MGDENSPHCPRNLQNLGESYKHDSLKIVMYRKDESEEYRQTGKAVCVECMQLLTVQDGSHVNRHVKERCKKRKLVATTGEDEYNEKKLSAALISKLTDASAKFCLRSGKAFNFCTSQSVNNYTLDVLNAVSSGYGLDCLKQLPTRTTIQKYTEELAKDLVLKAFNTVRPFAGNRLNLILDHGKLINNYLSVMGSYTDEEFKLMVVPLGFTPALDGKSTLETKNLIVKRFEEFDIPEELVLSSSVTADGALSGLSNYFKGYIRCVSHSLNLVAHRAVVPLDIHKNRMTTEELSTLAAVSDLMKNAQKVSNAIRTNVNLCSRLSILPVLCVETRWIIGIKCLTDVVELSEEIQANFSALSSIGKQAFSALNLDNFKFAKTVVKFFEEIELYTNVFQSQKSVTMHLVLPTYKRLRARWEKFRNFDFNDLKDSDIDNNAKRAIVNMIPKEATPVRVLEPTAKRDGIDSLYKLVSDSPEEQTEFDEFTQYLSEFVNYGSTETVEEYWRKKRNEFPLLFEVATRVFSIVPSEAVCETAFNTASYLLDKRRSRLGSKKAELVVLGSQIATKFPEWI
ncbi:hypothetical protein GCK72_000487 [Caenorhabditis remanei]|uniref:HAT C-terminal dimerisation domain-containing protein n=1 Tax=Caenorhabditis remanei TaxID=31234 RepID=A0A6A5HPZ5_CAERE|nr:hypothetical protein GCK72_000487 [Caenorhabditis remanei]KAF1768674.1 hypothetical protein GCK72_000487 [Caenorhabditis remanei]